MLHRSVNIVANQISFLLSYQFHYLSRLSYSEKNKNWNCTISIFNFQFSIFHFSLLRHHNHLSSFHFFKDLILLISIFNFQFHFFVTNNQFSSFHFFEELILLVIIFNFHFSFLRRIGLPLLTFNCLFLWRIDLAPQHNYSFYFFISLKNWFALSAYSIFTNSFLQGVPNSNYLQ